MIFPPIRDKEIVRAEAEASLAECRAIENSTEKRLFFHRHTQPLIVEYHTDVLDTFETEGEAVRIVKYGDRYFVSTYEISVTNGIRASLQGILFFGGTEDGDAAWKKYQEVIEGYKA